MYDVVTHKLIMVRVWFVFFLESSHQITPNHYLDLNEHGHNKRYGTRGVCIMTS